MSDSRGPPPDRTVEVCREFTRQRCQRSDGECRYAHPPSYCEVINGRVTCCFDSIKGRCQRDKCRYFHPPPHIGDQLLRGGGGGGRSSYDSRGSSRGSGGSRSDPYLQDVGSMNPYLGDALRGYKAALDAALAATSWLAQPSGSADRPSSRTDTIEVCREFLRGKCSRSESECRYAHPPDNINIGYDNSVIACIDFIKGRCQRSPCRYFHPPEHLQARVRFGGSGASSLGRKRPYSSVGSSRDDERGDGESNGDYKRAAYDGDRN